MGKPKKVPWRSTLPHFFFEDQNSNCLDFWSHGIIWGWLPDKSGNLRSFATTATVTIWAILQNIWCMNYNKTCSNPQKDRKVIHHYFCGILRFHFFGVSILVSYLIYLWFHLRENCPWDLSDAMMMSFIQIVPIWSSAVNFKPRCSAIIQRIYDNHMITMEFIMRKRIFLTFIYCAKTHSSNNILYQLSYMCNIYYIYTWYVAPPPPPGTHNFW